MTLSRTLQWPQNIILVSPSTQPYSNESLLSTPSSSPCMPSLSSFGSPKPLTPAIAVPYFSSQHHPHNHLVVAQPPKSCHVKIKQWRQHLCLDRRKESIVISMKEIMSFSASPVLSFSWAYLHLYLQALPLKPSSRHQKSTMHAMIVVCEEQI
jgi:hypothetical protein